MLLGSQLFLRTLQIELLEVLNFSDLLQDRCKLSEEEYGIYCESRKSILKIVINLKQFIHGSEDYKTVLIFTLKTIKIKQT